MKRRIIQIDREKCNGCGLCVAACHEGAIRLENGKAMLVRDDYCDGLGDCLPACPTSAITFVEREAAAYDEGAVQKHLKTRAASAHGVLPCGCPSTEAQTFDRPQNTAQAQAAQSGKDVSPASGARENSVRPQSELRQFPVQIKLVPVNAPYFDNAQLLIAADCTAFAYGDFHAEFMKGKITLVGCPKLDDTDYGEKLGEILKNNDIASLTVVRMEVPCCGGITAAVKDALKSSGKIIPWSVVTISRDGRRL